MRFVLLSCSKKKASDILWTVLIAFCFFLFSYAFIFKYLTNENILQATIWNLFVIIFFLLLDKVTTHFSDETSEKTPKKKTGLFSRFCQRLGTNTDVSTKATLYLFYVGLLICMALVAAEPDIPVLTDMKDYFQSVEYGFLILIAADTYLEQVFKDTANSKIKTQG